MKKVTSSPTPGRDADGLSDAGNDEADALGRALDSGSMRARNLNLLLNMIWRDRRISRADIARRTGLSPSTVSILVADLEAAGLVRALGDGASSGGRRPRLLGFCDDAFVIVGAELGATHIQVVLTDLHGQVRATREHGHPVRTDPEGALARLRELIDGCLKEHDGSAERVLGIGVAVPSPVLPPGQLSPLILPAWAGYDIQSVLAGAHGVPVLVDNDANLGALAERWWGAGAGGEDLTYIKLGTGIGAGHIINGALYRGAHGAAGEIGHIALDPTGPACTCGLRGCLASYIGSVAILEQAQKRVPAASATPTVGEIALAARDGDPAARALIGDVAARLGSAMATLLNVVDPAIIVLGGEITHAGDTLLGPLRESVRKRSFSATSGTARIVTSDLGDRAIAVGAATLVLQAWLSDHDLFTRAAARRGATATGPHRFVHS